MTSGDNETWLLIFPGEKLEMVLSTVAPTDGFVAGAVRYNNSDQGNIVATFDRLVDEHGGLIGVQVWPVTKYAQGVLDSLRGRSYLRLKEGESYASFFFGSHNAEAAVSLGDQSLIGGIFRNSSCDLAIAVHLEALALTKTDIARVRQAISQMSTGGTGLL
jgi:hypothetical protein